MGMMMTPLAPASCLFSPLAFDGHSHLLAQTEVTVPGLLECMVQFENECA